MTEQEGSSRTAAIEHAGKQNNSRSPEPRKPRAQPEWVD